jgi:5-(carboxyamino)imidazole ribonucleotide mutase
MVASLTLLPVIGVPVESRVLRGVDSLLSIVQMPTGVPVATMSIGPPGAKNAGLLAIQILALNDASLRQKLTQYRKDTADRIEHEKLS